MQITQREVRGITILDFQGDLTTEYAGQKLKENIHFLLDTIKQTWIILNCERLTEIDPIGWIGLVECLNQVQRQEGRLIFVKLAAVLEKEPQQKYFIRNTVLARFCFNSEEEAVQSFLTRSR